MLRNCYKNVKLEATNYLTEDVIYGIIKVHQGEGRNIIYTRRPQHEGAGSWELESCDGSWTMGAATAAGSWAVKYLTRAGSWIKFFI